MANKPVKLLSPFPKKLVKKAPAGKFGDYVPHANYVERLRDSGVKYSWSCEPVYGLHKGEKRIVGAKGTITIEDMGSYDGFGDIDTFKLDNPKFNDGTNLKDAESDAFKRACMRFGLGVELWSGSDVSEEEHTATLVSTADPDTDNVVVTKVDMRKKEHKKPAPVPRPIEEIGEDEAPFSETSQPADDKVDFINHTVEQMFEGYDDKTIRFALDLADNYAKVKKYPDKSLWTDIQIDDYLAKITLGLSSKVASVDDDDDLITKADVLLGGIVEKVENNQEPRTDLKCPCSNSLMVYDNRHDKKSDRSPDFVCSGRDTDECPMHTGKWRKSWWLNSSDLPKEWGFGS
jgi:hypothetical protein